MKSKKGSEMEVLEEAERIRKEVEKDKKVEKRQKGVRGESIGEAGLWRTRAKQRKGTELGIKWVPCSSAANTLCGLGRTNLPPSLLKGYVFLGDFRL